MMMPIAEIKIGQRHRRDLGDIAELAASISEVNLLHPVVVTSEGTLVAGQRRIEAFRFLGRSQIPVTVVDLDRVVRGEYAENSVLRDDAGKIKYAKILEWSDRTAADAFSEAVCAAVEREHPDAFVATEVAS